MHSLHKSGLSFRWQSEGNCVLNPQGESAVAQAITFRREPVDKEANVSSRLAACDILRSAPSQEFAAAYGFGRYPTPTCPSKWRGTTKCAFEAKIVSHWYKCNAELSAAFSAKWNSSLAIDSCPQMPLVVEQCHHTDIYGGTWIYNGKTIASFLFQLSEFRIVFWQ